MNKHSFWTRSYRGGYIHGCYNSVEKREEITLTLPDGQSRADHHYQEDAPMKKEKPKKPPRIFVCAGCGGKGTRCQHSCPYLGDVRGDDKSKCRCCAKCERECAMDI